MSYLLTQEDIPCSPSGSETSMPISKGEEKNAQLFMNDDLADNSHCESERPRASILNQVEMVENEEMELDKKLTDDNGEDPPKAFLTQADENESLMEEDDEDVDNDEIQIAGTGTSDEAVENHHLKVKNPTIESKEHTNRETSMDENDLNKVDADDRNNASVPYQSTEELKTSHVEETDYSDEEKPLHRTLMEKRSSNIQRSMAFARSLGLLPVETDEGTQIDSDDISSDEDDEKAKEDVVNEKHGMLLNLSSSELSSSGSCNSGNFLAEIQSRYPNRETEIFTLFSLLEHTMWHQARSYTPPPIFVTGVSGTGKTVIVRDIASSLQRRHIDSSKNTSNLPRVGCAYVNCAALDAPSIDDVIHSAYGQLEKQMIDQHQKGKKRKRKLRSKPENKRRSRSLPFTRVEIKEGDADQSVEKQALDSKAVDARSGIQQDSQISARPGCKNQDNNPRKQRLQSCLKSAVSNAAVGNTKVKLRTRMDPASNLAMKENFVERSLTNEVGGSTHQDLLKASPLTAIARFGRAIQPFFQIGDSAFLILDHADRLMSLTKKGSTGGQNFLTQLLLLPWEMKLNLTVIVITSSILLDQSRFNNHGEAQYYPCTLSNAIEPIKIHFPAYSGAGTFKMILNAPRVLELIIGDDLQSEIASGSCNHFMVQVVDAFLDVLIQSLSASTRDVKEFIRFGRMLWPSYVEPLNAANIEKTLEAARKRSSVPTEGGTEKELLLLLGQKFMPRIRFSMEDNLFSLTAGPSSSSTPISQLHDHDMPYLTKCLLLAAFICQNNKADKDKQLFTIQKNGRKRGRNKIFGNEEELAYGTVVGSSTQKIRPRLFPFERMISVFVSIVGLNRGNNNQNHEVNSLSSSYLGSSDFCEILSHLRDIGLLQEPAGSSQSRTINMTSPKYWCSLGREEADSIASSIGFPLESYLL